MMKIIFLDIDGVLNGWDFSEYVKYNIWKFIPSRKVKNFIRTKLSHIVDIDKKRFKRLAEICNKTNAKVVISSSWRSILFTPTGLKCQDNDRSKLFWSIIDKYNIEVIGRTASLLNSDEREDEIKAWLSDHNTEVENYIILDDEDMYSDAQIISHFVKTSHKEYKGWIAHSERKWIGLSEKHKRKAIKILEEII